MHGVEDEPEIPSTSVATQLRPNDEYRSSAIIGGAPPDRLQRCERAYRARARPSIWRLSKGPGTRVSCGRHDVSGLREQCAPFDVAWGDPEPPVRVRPVAAEWQAPRPEHL